MTLLRSGLLEGRAVAASGGVPARVAHGLAELGARVAELDSGLDEDDARDWAASRAPLHALVYDAREAFGGGGEAGLGRALERAWVATRAVATGALIPRGAGKVLLIAPRAAGGARFAVGGPLFGAGGARFARAGGARFAAAAQAALENLARTLSVEWARYGVTVVAIGHGAGISDDALAELVCFLVSPAGDYFSGCLFELGLIQTS